MSAVLVGIEPGDPLTVVGACAVFLLVAVAACLAPARRALRVSPLTALRDG
jgi:ABC-type lipoprotein release transport system permease subunit